jgi:hypothetical protein
MIPFREVKHAFIFFARAEVIKRTAFHGAFSPGIGGEKSPTRLYLRCPFLNQFSFDYKIFCQEFQ